MEIKNIKELLQPLLKHDKKFVSCDWKNLLPPGENYGSTILQVECKLMNDKDEEEVIHGIGKMCPPPGFLWEVFNTKVSFKKEIAIYNKIVPALNDFGCEKGIENLIDFIAEYYVSRISLDPLSEEVDENAILLLENLKKSGYDVCDRFIGFDLESAKFILKDLATMHASVIAYKLAKPEEFKVNILPYLDIHIFPENKEMDEASIRRLKESFSKFPECIPYLPKMEALGANLRNATINPSKTNEIFTTLTHNDYWINNTLLKYENGKPISNKMVDFQVIQHLSLAHDVIFFLYSSVELSVLENNLDDLIKFYYQAFVDILKKLQTDVTCYTFDALMKEFAIVGREMQLMHILFMCTPILTLKGKVKDLSELKISDIVVEDSSLHENYYKRIRFTLMDFVKRGWL